MRDPFRSAFQQWYDQYAGSGKPLIISSLAAIRGTQGQYLQDVSNDLPALFPTIKGIVYFDAPDRVNAVQYELNSNGASAFDALSHLASFHLSRQQSTVSVTATPGARGRLRSCHDNGLVGPHGSRWQFRLFRQWHHDSGMW